MARDPHGVRNAAFVGAGGAGKTTLVEALLQVAGVTTRRGSVPEGNTVTDWDDEERERGHSIVATPVVVPWKDHRLHLIDAPGALDFFGEAVSALAAVETALVVVHAGAEVGVATKRAFEAAREAGLACAVVITHAESDAADLQRLHAQIQTVLGPRAVPINLPHASGAGLMAIVDVFGKDLPAPLEERAAALRSQVTDRVVECDDALLERYIETGSVAPGELEAAFPRALRQGNVVPVLHVSVDKEAGLRQLLNFLVADCPGPATRRQTALRRALRAGESFEVPIGGAFSAQVWKVHVDPHVGKVAWLRVWSGGLASKTQFVSARTQTLARIGDLQRIHGKDLSPLPEAVAGDIVAVAKVDDISVGDTVHDGTADWVFQPIPMPVPKVTFAIVPKHRNDEARLWPELQRLADADPTFVAEREEATHEMVVRGLSTLHLDLTLKRLARRKVEAVTRPPRIPYRETIAGRSEGMYRHKKQSGGRGQFAEVHLRVEPLPRGAGFEFVDAVVGGSIPRQFIPAVEKGIIETCAKGVLAHNPFVDVRATVFFGKAHDVDSDEFSFRLAASQAFKVAVEQARPVLLEPIMKVNIDVPSRFMGDISGDLNSRRGRILSMDQQEDTARIEALVPLAEMMQYSTELRSLTAGEGDYVFDLDHYDVVPAHIAQDLIARGRKELAQA